MIGAISNSNTITIDDAVYFKKNKTPFKHTFNKDKTTLFVPESPNYPRFDFFIWDAKRQILMGFQVTILDPFTDHTKMAEQPMWQTYCSTQSATEFYWVVPKCCIGTNCTKYANDFIILFEDLESNFPVLRKLVFADE